MEKVGEASILESGLHQVPLQRSSTPRSGPLRRDLHESDAGERGFAKSSRSEGRIGLQSFCLGSRSKRERSRPERACESGEAKAQEAERPPKAAALLEKEDTQVRQPVRTKPGALGMQMICQTGETGGSCGAELDAAFHSRGLAASFLSRILLPNNRLATGVQRELNTLAEVIDGLAGARLAGTFDLVARRLRAVEAA